jgi:hypothetical protein
MDAWETAVQFLLIGDRAQSLAEAHPMLADGRCGRCSLPRCTAAALASEAVAVLAARVASESWPLVGNTYSVRHGRGHSAEMIADRA